MNANVSRAHNAKVPISVHLDHATDAEQLELAVGLAEQGIAFDSIMVDASHADVSSCSFRLCPWVFLELVLTPDRRGEHLHRCTMDQAMCCG